MIKITRRLEVEYKDEVRALKVGDSITFIKKEDKEFKKYLSGKIAAIKCMTFFIVSHLEGNSKLHRIDIEDVEQIIEVEQNIWGD